MKGARNPSGTFLVPSRNTSPNFSLLINVLARRKEEKSEEKKIVISQCFLEKEGSLQGMQKRSQNEESSISEGRRSTDNI